MNIHYFESVQYERRRSVLNAKGLTYGEFLKSKVWKQARQKLFKKEGKICRVCEKTSTLNVHHNKYNQHNLSGSIQGLVVLCRECHEEVHRIAKIRG